MDKMELSEVVEIAQQMEADGKENRNLYSKIDEAVDCKFQPDPAIEQLPFINGRKFALTDISDARNAGVRTFSSLLPNISISPVQEEQGEYDRVEKLEQAWKWELEKMNRPVNGKKGVHDQIVESAITYHAVALQTEYLPLKFKGKENDPRVKAILNRKCFNWVVHHPGTVVAKYSDYGMERVLKKGKHTAQQLIENFGKDNPGIQKFMLENSGKKLSELMQMKFYLFDYMDWKHRVQWMSPTEAGTVRYELMNEEHGLPFIPWVVVDMGDPLWKSTITSGVWDNIQHMSLIKFSKAVAMGMRSDLWVQTTDGSLKGVWIDYKNPLNPVVTGPGDKVTNLPANNLDPQFENEYQSLRADVSRSTVAKVLQDMTPYMNSPFSSLNAAVTMALGQLSPARRTAEAAIAEAIYQGFQWIKYSKIPFYGFRKKDGDAKGEGQPYRMGSHIYITHEEPPTAEELEAMSEDELNLMSQKTYFDLSSLYINIELKSANITDEQAKQNLLINAIREFGMSKKEAWERMGWDGFDMSQIQRAAEIMFDTELSNAQRLKQLEVEGIAMQQQMQIQQQAQAEQMAQEQAMMQEQAMQQQQNQMNAGAQFAPMQGMDMRGGSNPAAMGAPNETRETITGRTASGDMMV